MLNGASGLTQGRGRGVLPGCGFPSGSGPQHFLAQGSDLAAKVEVCRKHVEETWKGREGGGGLEIRRKNGKELRTDPRTLRGVCSASEGSQALAAGGLTGMVKQQRTLWPSG